MKIINNLKNRKIEEIENPINPESTIGDDPDFIERNEKNKDNFSFLLSIIFLVMVILLFRTFYLQIVKGEHYKNVSENNRIRSIPVKAPRGIIWDNNNQPLARNIPSFDVVFIPIDLPMDEKEREKIYEKLSKELEMSQVNIKEIIEGTEKNSKSSYLLKEGIDYEEALILTEKFEKMEGIYLEKTARRDYIDGPIFSHIIGYDGKITQEEKENHPEYLITDYIGKNGLEYVYEDLLRGKHGEHRMEVDSNGEIKEDLGVVSPVPGNEIILHLDGNLQRKAHEILSKILVENEDATGASLVAIDPRNGGVLALISLPSYDNNFFAKGMSKEQYELLTEDPRNPLLNRSINGEYPPGSTFKPLMAIGALEEKIIDEKTSINCQGSISLGQWKFPDWKAHGITDVKKAIAESCDVFFYTIGGGWGDIQGLGIDRMNSYAKLFGLGAPTGIDLPWEASGNIPNEEWKFKNFGEKWYIGNDYHFSIGQGFATATPLQMANATATIANGGTLFRPQLVNKIKKPSGEIEIKKSEIVRSDFVSRKNIEIVREGMKQTVFGENGSAKSLSDLTIETAGKTGTAQFGSEEKTHSWYVSFAPYENPEIAMAVLVEEGGEGHSFAVPATKDIYKWYFEERFVDESNNSEEKNNNL